MPTYEYYCEKCGCKFDYYQPITASALKVCPKEKCQQAAWGKGRVKRMIGSGAGIIFKGSGFYVTDYRSENYKAAAKKETSSPSPPAADTKTAPAKSDGKSTPAKSANKPAPAAPAKTGTSS